MKHRQIQNTRVASGSGQAERAPRERWRRVEYWLYLLCAAAALLVATPRANANPVFDEVRKVIQPDGSYVDVRIWGDEYYGVTESLDGYTLVRDPQTYFLCYARLTGDHNDLVSTGTRVGTAEPRDLGLTRHLRINPDAASAKALAARAEWLAREVRILGGRGESRGPTTGNVQGICLIVDFEDDVGAIPPASVYNYCNQVGFTGYFNNGSVRDYYYDVSDGMLTYTNYVPAAYYRAAHPKSYYTDPLISYGTRAVELITEALNALDGEGFDFSQYDADSNGNVDALNCFYAGLCPNNWAEGLWPHASGIYYCADGVCTQRYQITDMGAMGLDTFCHENGHMLMGWPDLYDYGYDSSGVGRFCIMCYGTSANNPCEPCAYMKYIAGWSNTTILSTPQTDLVVPTSSTNTFYKYNHPTDANEYYLIENRQQIGRDSQIPDAGLAIWHIDTLGSNNYQQMTPSQHYLVTLVQADGHWDLEHYVNYGDGEDLYGAPASTQCTPLSDPNTNWWDGSSSELYLTDISASGASMTFSFNSFDCNNNGIPDHCDVSCSSAECAAIPGCGQSQDCNGNGRPDECEPGDVCPPTDLHWVQTPTPISTTAITMQAAATDPSGVEYYFSATGVGSHPRYWGTNPIYTDTGLGANRSYSYRVKARDQSTAHNETPYSDTVAVATFIETPTGLSFGTITDTSIEVNALGTFSRLDQNLSGLYFEVTALDGTPVGGSGVNTWTQLSLSQTATATGLTPETTYRFRVRARNYYGVSQTPWYPASGYANQATGSPSCTLLGDINDDGAVNGLDVDGFVRAKLGAAPFAGEKQTCADYGGTLDEDVAAFVADLLGL
jgi:M6 family metalloprotease-like protein